MPTKDHPIDLVKYFSSIEDPRIDRQKLHALPDILFIVFCGSICGIESWEDFVAFAQCKLEFLKKHIPLTNGIPSKNTFQRVISRLNPEAFKACFLKWVADFESSLGDVIAIDGKVIRRSFDKANQQSAIHMVSAYAAEARLVLAQEKVAEKSNEITAIPKLIDMLNLKGATVTLDAMGCQKAIAEKIINAGGHYVIAVKGNQNALFEALTKHFNHFSDMKNNKLVDVFVAEEMNRNRLEKRECLATDQLDWLAMKDQWPGIKSCVAVKSQRTINGKQSTEFRYYISSRAANAEEHNKIIRAHWAIENSLHWVLDVVFNEDDSRIRTKNAAENMAIIKHIVMNKLRIAQADRPRKVSLKGLRKSAGWSDDSLLSILCKRI
ncbi:MAG: ISAs1 family transposase [Marinagarivorans sp.]|nr:ISAs1 family transposase [Marinagarivorans sp.]